LNVRRLLISAAGVASILAMTVGPTSVAAASSTVECGQLTGYTAPDPSGPTDGALQIGLLDPWVIAADATVSAEATSALPGIVNNAPTCVALDLDDGGVVTSIDFAASGTVTGMVDFDSGSGFYLFADRLIVPDFVTDANPSLAALFVTSYQAGTALTVTFSVDSTDGQLTGFDGTAEFCGPGRVSSNGDGHVGDAVIPATVLDGKATKALKMADGDDVCATVHSTGTIDPQDGSIASTTDVVITAAGPDPTAPPTSVDAGRVTTDADGGSLLPVLAIVFASAFALVTRRLRSTRI
jgi:hypothetical protein